MFNKISKAGVGLVGVIAFVVVVLAQALGLQIAQEEALLFARDIVGVVGFALTIYGQFDRKDLKAGLLRK